MNDDCRMISDPAEFRAIFEGVRSATDIQARMPAQVFRAGFGNRQFLEFDYLCTPRFWSMLQLLMARSEDDRTDLLVLDPDPDAYFYKESKRFGALSLPVSLSSQGYLDALNTGPKSSPVDAVGVNSFVLALAPPSLRWLVWGERDSDTMVLGYRCDFEGLSAADLAQSGMFALAAEDALYLSSRAWRDRAAFAAFARELLKNYSVGQPWNDPAEVRALDIAHKLVAGDVGVVAASRAFSSLANELGPGVENALRTFRGIDSETDDLPLGPVRHEWHPDALAVKDAELARCEAMYRQNALEACKEIIEYFRAR